jgi:hypothetical protein
MGEAIALANNDVVFLSWSYEEKIDSCLGFAVYRIESGGEKTPLPAWIGFHGESNPDWKPATLESWPVQKFSWRDLTATRGKAYAYEIVPRVGKPGALTSREDLRLTTNEVTLTPVCSPNVSAYFNRGILSTQALAHVLDKDADGSPSSTDLLKRIETIGDPVREALAGQIIEGVTALLRAAARDGSHCHAALYELNDPELLDLLDDPQHVSIVLSDAGEHDSTNSKARARLHQAGVDITDRMMPSGHIGHDKFLVKLGPQGTPQRVLTGSTNWTDTGLCAQANNAIVLSDETLAAAYLDFWNRIKAECPPSPAKATQSDAFRKANNEADRQSVIDGAEMILRLSPNTLAHQKPKDDPPAPADMAQLFDLIAAAKRGILFLLFQPGSPSVLDAILEAQAASAGLFVRGAATDPDAIESYETKLFHRTGEVAEIAAAAAVDHPFGSMQKELLKSSKVAHAIIHDKIVVIDPHSSDCIVVTGSHNLGYRASYANDENMLIIKGHQRLAQAYATHVMDIYDHYRWRWSVHRQEGGAASAGSGKDDSDGDSGGLASSEDWQSKYFSDPAVVAERSFWL